MQLALGPRSNLRPRPNPTMMQPNINRCIQLQPKCSKVVSRRILTSATASVVQFTLPQHNGPDTTINKMEIQNIYASLYLYYLYDPSTFDHPNHMKHRTYTETVNTDLRQYCSNAAVIVTLIIYCLPIT